MLEQIASLHGELLRAPPEVAVPAGIALVILLMRLALALPGRVRPVEDDGLEAAARRWIDERIDEHVEVLAEAYGEAGAPVADDELPPGFPSTIESFIAEVLLREQDRDGLDVDLGIAVREFVVLHRAEVYEDVAARTRAYLAAA